MAYHACRTLGLDGRSLNTAEARMTFNFSPGTKNSLLPQISRPFLHSLLIGERISCVLHHGPVPANERMADP